MTPAGGNMHEAALDVRSAVFLRTYAKALASGLGRVRKRGGRRAVHQVRVSCRRLRTGLSLFGMLLDPADTRRWRSRLRKILSRFGPARDLDVLLRFLKDYLERLPEGRESTRSGIPRLLTRLKAERAALDAGLARMAKRMRTADLPGELCLAARHIRPDHRKDVDAARIGRLHGLACRLIRRQAARVRQQGGTLLLARDIEGHHRLRIAVKKLRYTMEAYGGEGSGPDAAIRTLRDYQECLGDMRDADLWTERIRACMQAHGAGKQGTARGNRSDAGLQALYAHLRRRRRDRLYAARLIARKLDASGFQAALEQALAPAKPPPRIRLRRLEDPG